MFMHRYTYKHTHIHLYAILNEVEYARRVAKQLIHVLYVLYLETTLQM